jgi:hypothetical protein
MPRAAGVLSTRFADCVAAWPGAQAVRRTSSPIRREQAAHRPEKTRRGGFKPLALVRAANSQSRCTWRTFTIGDLRVRLVEYSAGYLVDHWCDLGHVLYVIEGELDTELRDGRTFKLRRG